MATLLKIIRSVDYLDISDDGTINFEESRKKLSEMASANITPVDYEILLDFRRTQWILSTDEIYYLVKVFLDDPDTFRDKIALLLLPGVNFDRAYFSELCAHDKVNTIRTFTNYEDAIQWFYLREGVHL
jgi:hypothetical protein